MAAEQTLHPVTPPRPQQRTWPPGDPSAPQDPAASGTWREAVVHHAGGLARDAHREWAENRRRSPPEPRPRASTTAIVALTLAMVALVALVGAITWHQLGANDYEDRQAERHRQMLDAMYELIDTVSVHHPEAAKVERRLDRGRVPR